MSMTMLNMAEPSPVTPREFFRDMVPIALDVQSDLARAAGGCFSFLLHGADGGEWTIDLADAQVRTGVDTRAQLTLEMDAHDFGRMLRGALDIEEAFLDGRIRHRGDIRSLTTLAPLLDPRVSP